MRSQATLVRCAPHASTNRSAGEGRWRSETVGAQPPARPLMLACEQGVASYAGGWLGNERASGTDRPVLGPSGRACLGCDGRGVSRGGTSGLGGRYARAGSQRPRLGSESGERAREGQLQTDSGRAVKGQRVRPRIRCDVPSGTLSVDGLAAFDYLASMLARLEACAALGLGLLGCLLGVLVLLSRAVHSRVTRARGGAPSDAVAECPASPPAPAATESRPDRAQPPDRSR